MRKMRAAAEPATLLRLRGWGEWGGVQSSGDLPFCAEVGFDRRGTCVIAHGRALTWTFLGAAVTAVCVFGGVGGCYTQLLL